MVTFRSRIGDDGTTTLYEAYFELLPNIEDQESIVVGSPQVSSDLNSIDSLGVPKDDAGLDYIYNGQTLLELKSASITISNSSGTLVWDIFNNPEHIRILQDPKEKYQEQDKYSAEPPNFDQYPPCHGVLVEFSGLDLPADFDFKVIADDGSTFIHEIGTIEP